MESPEHPLKTFIESSSLILQQHSQLKNNRQIKFISLDLTSHLHSQGFIDPDFSHSQSSINQNQQSIEANIKWIPAQTLRTQTNYSSAFVAIEDDMFSKKVIGQALTLINWFANDVFHEVFMKELSKNRLYIFDIMVEGTFLKMPIDSYIPVSSKTGEELFSKNNKGSIFPCLYQKLLAKIYHDYDSITSQFIDIIELQTFFCRQEVSLTQRNINIKELAALMSDKIEKESIVCFRTRNSIRLESLGLESNYIYVVLRVLYKDGESVIQFLQLQGESWIGKMSKLRASWLLQDVNFMQKNNIAASSQYKQNYMTIRDMQGLSRQLIILNNTISYHKNYHICTHNPSHATMYHFSLKEQNKIMIRAHYKQKKCYNSLILTKRTKDKSKMISSQFEQNKDSNYLEANLQPGQYSLFVYNTHPQEKQIHYNLTIFSSTQFVQIQANRSSRSTRQALQSTFKEYFQSQNFVKSQQVLFKQLYNSTGMAFIFLQPKQDHYLKITINRKMFQDCKIFPFNIKGNQEEISQQTETEKIYVFRCLWNKKQNISFLHDYQTQQQKLMFPPLESVKVIQKKKRS